MDRLLKSDFDLFWEKVKWYNKTKYQILSKQLYLLVWLCHGGLFDCLRRFQFVKYKLTEPGSDWALEGSRRLLKSSVHRRRRPAFNNQLCSGFKTIQCTLLKFNFMKLEYIFKLHKTDICVYLSASVGSEGISLREMVGSRTPWSIFFVLKAWYWSASL